MNKINKKITLFLIIFAIGFLYLLSGKVEASEVTLVTNPIELLSTLESPTINTNVRLDNDIELKISDDTCNYNIAADSVFDLNGHTLTINRTVGFEAGINVFFQDDNCTLTITDSAGEGKIDGKLSTNSLIQFCNFKENNTYYENCNVIIDGGIYEGPSSRNYLITTSNSDNIGLTINEGTFITNFNSATVLTYNSIKLTINQMTISTNIEMANFNITNDQTKISQVVDSNSDIWVNGIRKYTDNLENEISSIYGDYDSINNRPGIIEIKTKSGCDETVYVETIDELNNAIQTPEVKNIILDGDIDSSNDLEIIINGNEKILDLNGCYLSLDDESKIKVKYYTNHNFTINNDIEMLGTIESRRVDASSRSVFVPINYTQGKINMIINGAAVETTAKRVFEDTNKFYLTINNGFFFCSNALFEFRTTYDSKITINRLTIRNIEGDQGEILKFASNKHSLDPISEILGPNSKLVYIDGDNELIDQPNSITCGEAYRGDGTLIVMPSKDLIKIEKTVIPTQEYGYSVPEPTAITIKNISEDTVTILNDRNVMLKDDNGDFSIVCKTNKFPIEILSGQKNNETITIRPKQDLKPGIYKNTIIINTIDGDEYRGEIEFEVTKLPQDLSVNISDWNYGDTAVKPTGDGNIGTANEHFEYALKEEGKTIDQLDFSETVPTHAGKYIVKYVVEDTDEIYAGGYAIKEFEIKRKEVTLQVNGYEENYTYNGDAYKPEVNVKLTEGDITLVKDEDYTVEYGENINKGEGTITIKSANTSNYVFEDVQCSFNILAKEIQESDVEVTERMGYTGQALTPDVTVNVDGKVLVKETDYTVTFDGQDREPGKQIDITVEGKGNYTGTVIKHTNIIEKMDQKLSFTASTITKKYTDSKFTIVATHNEGDGVISYKSSNTSVAKVNRATGEVTIVGVGDAEIIATASETSLYKQIEISYKLTVNKADYDTSKIKFENMSFAYDGKLHSIAAYGLPAGVKVSYTNNGKTDVGTYQVTASFTGDYAHYNTIPNKTATLTITNKSITNTIVSGIIDKTYTGNKITQSLNLKDGNITLRDGIDYTISYSSNKKIGIATITITGKGIYAGTITRTFKINPKGTSLKKLTAGKKQFKATWKAQKTQTTGYEVQYSTSKNFNSGNKKVKITKNKTTSSTVKKLKAKKKYYVRIRTYKLVNGNKFYSGWSKVLSVKTKK